jgi:hypothetical protein
LNYENTALKLFNDKINREELYYIIILKRIKKEEITHEKIVPRHFERFTDFTRLSCSLTTDIYGILFRLYRPS